MKKHFFSLSLVTKLLGLFILLTIANCNCDNQMVEGNDNQGPIPNQRIQSSTLDKTTTTGQSNLPQPNLLLKGEEKVTGSSVISFTLTNQADQAFDLKDIKVMITLDETIGFNDQPLQEGEIAAYSLIKETKLNQSREITLSLAELLEISQLAPHGDSTIKLDLVGIDNLDRAKITFQIKDQHNQVIKGCAATTNWKSSGKLGPFSGKSKIAPTPDFADFTLDQGNLKLPIKFKNESDHPIDLKKLDYIITITDKNTGQEVLQEKCFGENVHLQNSILLQGQAINTLHLNIPRVGNKDFAEALTEGNLQCKFVSVIKADEKEIGKYDEPIHLTIGPIKGQSKMEVEITNTNNESQEQDNLHFQLMVNITNKSAHPINPKLATYRYKVLKNGTPLADGTLKGDQLVKDSNVIIPASSQSNNRQQKQSYELSPIDIVLKGYTMQKYNTEVHAKAITFEVEMLTLDESYVLDKGSRNS